MWNESRHSRAGALAVGKAAVRSLGGEGALDRSAGTIAGRRIIAEPQMDAQRAEQVGVVDVHVGRRVIREEAPGSTHSSSRTHCAAAIARVRRCAWSDLAAPSSRPWTANDVTTTFGLPAG